jgi:hypothetical protein
VQYQDALEGKAKFLKQSTRLFYSQGYTRNKRDTGWRQRLSTEVIGELELNESIPDSAFAVEFAPGTRVNDNIRLANYLVSPPLAVERHTMWPYTLAIVIVLLIMTVYRRLHPT